MAAEGAGGGGSDGGGCGGGRGGGGGGGNEMAGTSPKNRVKLLCSHGGKILPRATDGVLKYVGGETRVVAFSRDINFSELKQKVTSLFDGDLVLKYQLSPEDLDALVSVKSDEDLRHMLDEYDRQEGEGTPRLRAFLFPSAPVVLDVQITSTDPHALEQRYIDAINGIVRIRPTLKIIPPKPSLASFTISSACSSPNSLSPDPFSHDSTTSHESVVPRGALMHKVRSSPSLYSPDQQTADTHLSSPLVYQHPNHYHQNYQQYHHPGFQSARPPQDPSKGAAGERSTSGLSKGRTDSGRGLMGSGPSSYYSSARQHKGFGSSNKYVHLEEGSSHGGQKA
ncbi:uncharacterized protein LOC100257434 [Vitis vinifera]|nr:uncharacterized protein LOC100257434 [Vitis vinifera]XP_010657972.1 uncharacterized protein LOC100257434 [Vitis vinifera]|eukprot:XP_002263275.2 PREDICTED: uncharacterized protein LOC100257434 [Vitis vinifera]